MKICNFWCEFCTCGARGKDKDFEGELSQEDDETKVPCPNNSTVFLKLMGYKSNTGVIDKSKHSKGRSPKEREKRRTGDFIKNTLPTLDPEDKAHFEKKFKIKKQ